MTRISLVRRSRLLSIARQIHDLRRANNDGPGRMSQACRQFGDVAATVDGSDRRAFLVPAGPPVAGDVAAMEAWISLVATD